MWSPLPLLCLVGLASVYADYSVPAADQPAPAASVVQVPVPAPLEYNQPAYTNVRAGYAHGPFLDGFVNNFHHSRHHKKHRHSSSDSDEHRPRRRHHRRRHHGHHQPAPYYPGYFPSFPGYGYQETVLSNPFYVPDRHHKRRRHRKHHRKDRRRSRSGSRSNSRSGSRSNSDSRDSHSWSGDKSD